MISLKSALKLCLVIGPTDCYFYDMFTIIKESIAGGITSIQLRDKNLDEKHIYELGKRVLKTLPSSFLLIINDYVDVAKKLKVAVHLGQSDMECCLARKRLGKNSIIGLSIENIEQAKYYQYSEIDYFGIGPVFSTTSKLNVSQDIGIEGLMDIFKLLSHKPCLAIGGISTYNIDLLNKIGIDGIAVISAITQSKQPCLVAQMLLKSRNKSND